MIFRPEEVHFGRFPKSNKYSFISFLIPTDIFDNVFVSDKSIIAPFCDTSCDRANLIRFPEKEKKEIIDIAEEILETLRRDVCYDVLLFSKLAEALSLCNRFYASQTKTPLKTDFPRIITQIIRRIDESFPDFEGLDALSEYIGCSTTHITQTFRRYTGKSIYGYLTERRLEYARRLLQRGASVTEACYQSGFFDCSSFISLFKKNFGITPGKYKNMS